MSSWVLLLFFNISSIAWLVVNLKPSGLLSLVMHSSMTSSSSIVFSLWAAISVSSVEIGRNKIFSSSTGVLPYFLTYLDSKSISSCVFTSFPVANQKSS